MPVVMEQAWHLFIARGHQTPECEERVGRDWAIQSKQGRDVPLKRRVSPNDWEGKTHLCWAAKFHLNNTANQLACYLKLSLLPPDAWALYFVADDEPSFNRKFCLAIRCEPFLSSGQASYLVWTSHGCVIPRCLLLVLGCITWFTETHQKSAAERFSVYQKWRLYKTASFLTQRFEFCTRRVCCAVWICSIYLVTVS